MIPDSYGRSFVVRCADCPPHVPLADETRAWVEFCPDCAQSTADRHTAAFPDHRVTVTPPQERVEPDRKTTRLLGRQGW